METKINIDINKVKHLKPHFEILCYGGKVYTSYFISMMKLTILASQIGMEFSFNTIVNESLVTRARNTAVANFLNQKEATHLIFIDVDQGFEPWHILLLLQDDLPIVTAPVALKTIPLRFNINLLKGETVNENGLVKTARAGTGAMVIKREVFETLNNHTAVIKYSDDINGGFGIDPSYFRTYFNTAVKTDEDGQTRFMSEDFDFCEKAKEMGYDIWCDTRINMSHIGNFEYGEAQIKDLVAKITNKPA
jgi:hypothetical protein